MASENPVGLSEIKIVELHKIYGLDLEKVFTLPHDEWDTAGINKTAQPEKSVCAKMYTFNILHKIGARCTTLTLAPKP